MTPDDLQALVSANEKAMAIEAKAAELNALMRDATAAGLRVTLDVVTRTSMNTVPYTPFAEVHVFMPLGSHV